MYLIYLIILREGNRWPCRGAGLTNSLLLSKRGENLIMTELNCYGFYKKRDDTCVKCPYASYCKDSTEINRDAFSEHHEYQDNIAQKTQEVYEQRFSRQQLIQLVRLAFSIDNKEDREMIKIKLQFPDVTLTQLARKKGVSKQAIGKSFRRISREYPEITGILHNKPGFNNWRNEYGKR